MNILADTRKRLQRPIKYNNVVTPTIVAHSFVSLTPTHRKLTIAVNHREDGPASYSYKPRRNDYTRSKLLKKHFYYRVTRLHFFDGRKLF